jgi:hypothetical protein
MIAPQRSNIVSQKMNKFHFIVFAVVVAALNVLFNAILQRASQRGGSLIEAILSPKFFLAACVGVLSAMSLLAVYRSGANLAQGIILMGALSISFGTVVGIWRGSILHPIEWALFIAIVLFYAARFLVID